MRIQEVVQEIEALGVSLAGRNEAMAPEDVHRLRGALRRWHESLTTITDNKGPAAPRFRGDVQKAPVGWRVVLRPPGRVPWDIEDAQALLDALDLPKKAPFYGTALIAAERQRQVTEEVWTPEHDDAHELGEMARAAAAYALPPDIGVYRVWREDLWPWGSGWWKPGDRIRELVKAGALIAAEIDRLQRERDNE